MALLPNGLYVPDGSGVPSRADLVAMQESHSQAPYDTGWVAANVTDYQVRRIGRIVYFRGNGTFTGGLANATSWNRVDLVPVGFRPHNGINIAGGMNGRPVEVVVWSTGELVTINHTGATRTTFRCSGSWVAA